MGHDRGAHGAFMRLLVLAVAAVLIPALGCSSPAPPSGPTCSSRETENAFTLAAPGPARDAIADHVECIDSGSSTQIESAPACVVAAAGNVDTCDCKGPGLRGVTAQHSGLADLVRKTPAGAGTNCVCEVVPYTGADLRACENDTTSLGLGKSPAGFCFLDGTTSPPSCNVELLKSCPSTLRRGVRIRGGALLASWITTTVTVCDFESCASE